MVRPFLHHAAKAFGPERLVFGTDWSVRTLAATHQQVVALARDLLSELYGPDEVAKIFGGNATRFYRLPDNA